MLDIILGVEDRGMKKILCLLMYLESSGKYLKHLGLCYPCWRHEWNSWLLASVCTGPSSFAIAVEPADEDLSFSVCLSLPLCISPFYIAVPFK